MGIPRRVKRRRRAVFLALAAVALALAAVLAVRAETGGRHQASASADQPTWQPLIDLGLPIYCGGGRGPWIALTFDDGPGQYTAQLLRVLRESGSRATFFLLGPNAVRRPRLVAEEESLGAVGVHSWSHAYLPNLTPAAINVDLTRAKRAIEPRAGVRIRIFRPPFGTNDQVVLDAARKLDMLTVLWNVDSGDASGPSSIDAATTYSNLAERVKPGAIVLMHENVGGGSTVAAVRRFLPELKRRGLIPVSVPELLERDPPPVEQIVKGPGGCHGLWKPGDPIPSP